MPLGRAIYTATRCQVLSTCLTIDSRAHSRCASCAVQLLEEKFFDDTKLFQVLDKPIKLVQGGVSGDPEVQKKWKHALIKDDPRLVTNRRGTFAFASSVPNSRTPQFIINLSDNGRMMDGRGPYGMVSLPLR